MSFLPIQPCCLKGQVLPGEPKGEYQPVSSTRQVGRYIALPPNGLIKEGMDKKAILLFSDIFGYSIPNPKILGDLLAEKLGVEVIVPEYLPGAPPPSIMQALNPSYPDQFAKRSYISTFFESIYAIARILPYFNTVRFGPGYERAKLVIQELRAEGYTEFAGIGFCRGGSIVVSLLAEPDSSGLACGVIAHPGPNDREAYSKVSKPTRWCLAEHDQFFKADSVKVVRETFEGREAEFEVYPNTVHGFATRPNLEHEPSRQAFEAANESAVQFFQKHFISS